MKNILILSVLLFAGSLQAADDCDLFKEEVAVISEQVQAMYKEMYAAKDFVKTAEERKTESDNQKLGRYMSSIKKELNLIEHGMSQLKLHQDCACPEFKFQYVDNTIIEIKYWLKKAQSVDKAKPKKTDYTTIETNLNKSMDKVSNLQVYFMKPCSGDVVAKTETEVTEPSSTPIETATLDTIEEVDEIEKTSEPMEVAAAPTQVMDTVKHSDVSVNTEAESEVIDQQIKDGEEDPKSEVASSENEAPENPTENTVSENNTSTTVDPGGNSNSGTGAVAAGAAVIAGTAVAIAESNNNEPDSAKQEQPNESQPEEVIAEKDDEEIAPVVAASSVVMDTVKHTDVSSEPKESSATPETGANIAGETEALGNTALVAGAVTAAAVTSDNKDSSKTDVKLNENASAVVLSGDSNNIEETTMVEPNEAPERELTAPVVVMDTVKHKDVSEGAKTQPKIEEPKAEVVETPSAPVVKAPVVAAAVSTPLVKANPVPNDFHYSVQIATGNANTSDAKYTALGEEVYSVNESGMNKYRVGKYKSLEEAKASKNKAFSAGFIDAFIVVYNNGSRISFSEAKNIENGGAVSSTNSNKPSSTPSVTPEKIKTPKLKKKDDVFLAVQIGANLSTTDPVYELIKYERLVGMEVHVLHGDPMRFYTGKAITASEADALLLSVKKAGIQEAFLIGISNDKRIDYNAALEFLGL